MSWNLTKNLALLLAAVGLVLAGGGAPASLDKLVGASSHIVVGKVLEGTVSGTDVALSIEVERALKGTLATGRVIAASGRVTEPTPARPAGRGRGIFFLSEEGPGALRLVPAVSGYLLDEMRLLLQLPSVSSPAAQAGVDASPKDRVLLEVLGGIETGEKPAGPGGVIELFSEYRRAPGPLVRSVFQRWMRGGSPKLAAMGVRALIAEGDPEALSRIESDATLRRSPAASEAFDGLKFYFKNPDPAAVAALGRMATSGSAEPELRLAAAAALARVHTKESLPFLAALLDSPDLDLRTVAVGGLSMFANDVPIGGGSPSARPWPYRTEQTIAHSSMDRGHIQANEAYYVGFWKAWWNDNRASIASLR